MKSELELLNFKVQTVKRFGFQQKPMPICLVILPSDPNAKRIYDLTQLFYIKISIQLYRNNDPTQCHKFQQFSHGSGNYGLPQKCVKCSGGHLINSCSKTNDTDPTCCNCGGRHTANYHGCLSFIFATTITNSSTQIITTQLPVNNV